MLYQAKVLTEKEGWPKIFEEAICARWNTPPPSSSAPMIVEQSMSQDVSQKVAALVVQNLTFLKSTFRSKFVGNIIQNIHLAAAYLNVLTVVSWLASSWFACDSVPAGRHRHTFRQRLQHQACGMSA